MAAPLQKIAGKLSAETEYKDTGVIYYGLYNLCSFILGFGVLAILAVFLNVFPHAVIAALVSSVLRNLSGGAHASTPVRCLVFGTVAFLILGKIAVYLASVQQAQFYPAAAAITAGVAIVCILKFGYATTHKKHLSSYSHGKKLRNSAIILITAWLLYVLYLTVPGALNQFNSVFIASSITGILWHSFNLTAAGWKFTEKADRCLQFLKL